jgi:integrase
VRDKAAETHGRRFGNYVKQVFSLLFAWGAERGYVRENTAAGIHGLKRPKNLPDANRPWTDSERAAVLAALPAHMELPIALMMFMGLDPQDAVKLLRNSIDGERLDTRRGKTGVPVWCPLPASVKDSLARAPAHDAITVCANSSGKPWTVSGFRASWRPIKLRLEQEGKIGIGLTLKGLRHTVATILAEMGYDERTIADLLGQKTIEMARHYSKTANLSRKMGEVTPMFDAEMNRRGAKVVKPFGNLSNQQRGEK